LREYWYCDLALISKTKTFMPHTTGTLHFIRKRRRLSQKQVAILIGHRNTKMLSKYEVGSTVPPLRTAFKLMLLYQRPLQELFMGEFTFAQAELADRTKAQHPSQPTLF
jgi:transcriptional regulator with XRE-family HTH domain